ncbi:MAG TPA: hypothetical protein VLE96_00725, partial [Chlamydiales bacterium]|nr:hypothetical protein [Chlamydiales bacterium]
MGTSSARPPLELILFIKLLIKVEIKQQNHHIQSEKNELIMEFIHASHINFSRPEQAQEFSMAAINYPILYQRD